MPIAEAERARAQWLERFPEGFEERELGGKLELAAYVEEIPGGIDGIQVEPVEDGWDERWREFHRSVRIGPLWVGPPWEAAPEGSIPVVIDPGLAFGTGAHPTTRLCAEFLLELDPGSLLDLGCGSGVLAIAAAKLGFEPVTAADDDPRAIGATDQNARVNGVSVDARLLDATTDELPRANVALANIEPAAIHALASRLDCDRLVASGYLERDRLDLPGFRSLRRKTAAGWAADLYGRE